jgi:hypothetical protein
LLLVIVRTLAAASTRSNLQLISNSQDFSSRPHLTLLYKAISLLAMQYEEEQSRAGLSMDASQDVWDWDWEVVMPDHRSFSTSHGSKNLDGKDDHLLCFTYVILVMTVLNCMADKETEEHDLLSPSGNVDDVQGECKDIGVVLDETCKSVVPSVVDPIMADGGEEEKAIQSPDPIMAPDGKFAQEEEEDIKKDGDDKVGALIGALCSFGVAAATACVFLIGGRLHHHHTQQHKIQLQFFGDDKVGCMTHSAQNNPSVISLFPGGFF